jgi:hypothetical protein
MKREKKHENIFRNSNPEDVDRSCEEFNMKES